ncbi:MAG TPA: hypothetical protein VGK59_10880 [Ohtaekwangia sp.]
MSKKKKNTGAAAKVAALTPEQFAGLSPEEQAKYVADLQNTNAALTDKTVELEGKLKEAKPDELPSIEVDEDEENEIEGGTYQFTCPTFTWDDGSVINVRELVDGLKSKDKKTKTKAENIVAKLVAIKSGILTLKAKADKAEEQEG